MDKLSKKVKKLADEPKNLAKEDKQKCDGWES
jgi:hypothetical protein